MMIDKTDLKNRKGENLLRRIDPATTIVPLIVILVLCTFFLVNPEGSTNLLFIKCLVGGRA